MESMNRWYMDNFHMSDTTILDIIAERMRAMIDEVTIDSIPDWFALALSNRSPLPQRAVGDRFENKIKELKAELEK